MKNIKELKKTVFERMTRCWAECCAVFFIIAGGLSALVLAWLMLEDFLRAVDMADDTAQMIDLSNKFMLSATIALIVLLWMLLTPFEYGLKWYRIQQINGNVVHLRSIFSCYTSFKKFLQVMNLNSMLTLRKMCIFLPLAAVELAAAYIVRKISASANSVAYNIAFVFLLLLTAGLFCIYRAVCVKYTAAPYIYVIEPELPAAEIIEKSRKIMENNSNYLFETLRSMLLPMMTCLMIFPMVFIIPYMQMLYTAAIAEIINSNKETGADSKNERYEEQLTAN